MQYSPDAIDVAYGRGSDALGLRMSATAPYAGSEFFQVTLRGGTALKPVLPNGTPCVLLLSLAPAASRSAAVCNS